MLTSSWPAASHCCRRMEESVLLAERTQREKDELQVGWLGPGRG